MSRPAAAVKAKTFPVVEVFGPTIQGEGALAGAPSYFIRFGGCDWRCAWCDSMHAVEPELVREAPRLSVAQIVARLEPRKARWVTLSGGNPVLHELGALCDELHERDHYVAVETQGSRWRDWLLEVDHLTVSPKPPSSGEDGPRQRERVKAFMEHLRHRGPPASLKIVVFDVQDLAYALRTARAFSWLPFYISVGTDSQGKEPLIDTAERYRHICELIAKNGSSEAVRCRVLPQLHVIAWGHRLGV